MTTLLRKSRRGLTIVELLLAITITAMVAAGISAMLGAVWTGVEARREARTLLVQAASAQMRMAAYITPSRCVLAATSTDLVLWLNDARESDTVHTSEIRWLIYSENDGIIEACFVKFPDNWSDIDRQLEDQEHSLGTDWFHLLSTLQSRGHIARFPLVDGLESASVSLSDQNPLESRQVVYRLAFDLDTDENETIVSAAIIDHHAPKW